MAIAQRRPQGVIHHSDKGAQYTSLAFGKRCRDKGNRDLDRVCRGLLRQCDGGELFRQRLECGSSSTGVRSRRQAEARMAIFRFIEGWYNTKRRHSGLGYLSPNEFERRAAAPARQAHSDAPGRNRTGLEALPDRPAGDPEQPSTQTLNAESPREIPFHRLSPTSGPCGDGCPQPSTRIGLTPGNRGALVFPGTPPGALMGNVVMTQALRNAGVAASGHGILSSFKGWARQHDVDELLSEGSRWRTWTGLRSDRRRVSKRDDLLEKRRPVMQAVGRLASRGRGGFRTGHGPLIDSCGVRRLDGDAPLVAVTHATETMSRAVVAFVGRAVCGDKAAVTTATAAGSGRSRLPRHVARWGLRSSDGPLNRPYVAAAARVIRRFLWCRFGAGAIVAAMWEPPWVGVVGSHPDRLGDPRQPVEIRCRRDAP